MTASPSTARRDLTNLAGALLLPFVLLTVLLTLGDAGFAVHYFVMLGASLLSGLAFLWRTVGRHTLWMGLLYLPLMAFLLVMYTTMWACETGKGCM